MTEAAAEKNTFVRDFDRFESETGDSVPSWLRKLRRLALERFESLGLPTSKDEDWRNTPIAQLSRTSFDLAPSSSVDPRDLARVAIDDPGCARAVFVNGRYAHSLSSRKHLAKDVQVGSLAEAILATPAEIEPHLAKHARFDHHPFNALNTAFLKDGAYVAVPKGTVLKEPIQILHVSVPSSRPTVSHPRTLIVVGDHSQVELTELYVSPADGVYLTNAVTEIVVGENAHVGHCRVEAESSRAHHIGVLQAGQARNSRLTSHNVSFGAVLARHDTGSVLREPGSECLLNGLYLADDDRVVDNHTSLDHAAPNCESHELYKGILGGRARAVFNGRIIVRPDAQKTDAKQSNRNLLLSDEAMVYTRPQLEIYANDVKCTHGATIGRLDEDAMFYLRSRGIPAAEARDLLIHAFMKELLDRVPAAGVRAWLERELDIRLPRSIASIESRSRA